MLLFCIVKTLRIYPWVIGHAVAVSYSYSIIIYYIITRGYKLQTGRRQSVSVYIPVLVYIRALNFILMYIYIHTSVSCVLSMCESGNPTSCKILGNEFRCVFVDICMCVCVYIWLVAHVMTEYTLYCPLSSAYICALQITICDTTTT